jgi:predicted transposase YdaD
MQRGTPDRPDYDQPLKRLLVQAHDGFLQLVAPGLIFRGEAESELRAEPRRADLVWEVEAPGGARGLLHVELQTNPDPHMGERLAEYALRLWRRDHKPLRSLVVYLRPSDALPEPSFAVTDWSGREGLRFTYDVVRLWEVPPERVLDTVYYELWPLAGLMGNVTPEATMRAADKIAGAPLPEKRREELTASLLLLAGMRIAQPALRQLVQWRRHMLTDKDIWEASVLKDVLRDLAYEEGEAHGREEGKAEATREAVRTVLAARFGALDEALLSAIQAADPAALETLYAPAATETLEQIRARLGLS